MQLGRCCKCSQNPLGMDVFRHFKPVGPLPSEMVNDIAPILWGTYNPSDPNFRYLKGRSGYYITAPNTTILTPPYATSVLSRPFRFVMCDWSESFAGLKQREESPRYLITSNGSIAQYGPYDIYRSTTYPPQSGSTNSMVNTLHNTPPSDKTTPEVCSHLAGYRSTLKWGFWGFPGYAEFPRHGWPRTIDVYQTIKSGTVKQGTVSCYVKYVRVWANGVDITGIVEPTSTLTWGSNDRLQSVAIPRGATVFVDFWYELTIQPTNGTSNFSQLGYLCGLPGDNVFSVAEYQKSRGAVSGYSVSFSGGTVGGLSQATLTNNQPPGFFYEEDYFGSTLLGQYGFYQTYSPTGEGFVVDTNREVPLIQVMKPIPGAPLGSPQKRLVSYMPQASGHYAGLVMPNGVKHTPGAWNIGAATTFTPYSQGYVDTTVSLNLPLTQWGDFRNSGNTPPLWSPGDGVYSSFPSSILLSPP